MERSAGAPQTLPAETSMKNDLFQHRQEINEALERYGVKFSLYKDGEFHEQLFPFDPLPRMISAPDFRKMEEGLIQRAMALNLFLQDIYSHRLILRDNVIPGEFVFSAKGFLPECMDFTPIRGIYNHISGIDLVEAEDGWYVLEDNLRVPSGASYPMIAREITRKISPEIFSEYPVKENRNYGRLLSRMFQDVNPGGIPIVLTPGRYNAAFFEHAYLAEKSGATLAFPHDLLVEDDQLFYRRASGKKDRVGVMYRRISDEYLDPLVFEENSMIGVPHIMHVYRAGNLALVNAAGNGIADDKGIYYFVPAMIRYYLGEEPILRNAPTYLPFYPEDQKYILENLEKLVIKDVSEAGGYGVLFGRDLSAAELDNLRRHILAEPRRFIAQEIIHFKDLEVAEEGENPVKVPRKADFRAFVIIGKDIQVWNSGLTRFSRDAKSFIVNSSQGGGFKDTWVMSR